MSTATRRVVVTETAKQSKTPGGANDAKLSQAAANNYAAQLDAQRRKWGTDTDAVRSVHARKF